MLFVLALSVLGATATSLPGQRIAELSITFTATIVASYQIRASIAQLDSDFSALQKLVVRESFSGQPEMKDVNKTFLVLDGLGILQFQPITIVATGDGTIRIQHHQLVAVYKWPKDKSEKQLIAEYKKRYNIMARK